MKKKRTKKSLSKQRKEKDVRYIWLIAYINRDFLSIAESELVRYGYDIEAYIPTVRVLKKKFKGKNVFDFEPLYFNYGFFKCKYTDACNPEFLLELRSRISCIYGWVKDPANSMKKNISLRTDNIESPIALPGTAFATDKDVALMAQNTENMGIYSADELKRFKKGDYIQLKGYPFDNVPAEIKKINFKKKEIIVELQLDAIVKEVTVSFENVFYTVYQGYDDNLMSDISFDELDARDDHSTVDKLMFKNTYYEDEE